MKASDWISVKDRLPKNGERVLVLREYNGEQIVDVAMRQDGIGKKIVLTATMSLIGKKMFYRKKKNNYEQYKRTCKREIKSIK